MRGEVRAVTFGGLGHFEYGRIHPFKDGQVNAFEVVACSRVGELVTSMAADQGWIESLERRARALPADTGERDRLQAERRRAAKAWIAGELEESDYREVMDAIDARLARVPGPMPGRVVFTGKRFKTFADVWAVLSTEKKREALRVIWERVYVDVEARRVWFRPQAEFEEMFRSRRAWVRGTPDRTRTSSVPIESRPWLFEDVELVA